MNSLRERRHRETTHRLVEVAFELFVDGGFTDVTMQEIADAAGVSRSTVYRRFPTKDDIVLEVPRRWLMAFDDALATLPDEPSLRNAVTVPMLAVAAHIDEHHATVRTAYSILEGSSTLQHSGVATTAWLQRVAKVFDEFSDVDPEASLVLAGAYLGAIDAMMLHWASNGGTASVTTSTQRLLHRLEPLLSAARARREPLGVPAR